MHTDAGDLVVGILVSVLGLIGLVLGAGAVDDGMYVFGLSLFAFALLFVLGIIRRSAARRDVALAAARVRARNDV